MRRMVSKSPVASAARARSRSSRLRARKRCTSTSRSFSTITVSAGSAPASDDWLCAVPLSVLICSSRSRNAERGAHVIAQAFAIDRLPEKSIAAAGNRTLRFGPILISGEREDRSDVALGTQRRYGVEPAHYRHVHIHQYQTRTFGECHIDRTASVFRDDYPYAHPAQLVRNQLTDVFVVLSHEDQWRR